jgi:hypothetical protein
MQKDKIHWIMSNSAVKDVLNSFSSSEYKHYKIVCSRRINSKNPESKTTEVIICA